MRNLTRIALLIALVLALGSPAAFGNDDQGEDNKLTPEGTWLVKVLFLPGVLDFELQYLQTFNKDGRTTFLLPTGGPEDYLETGDTRIGFMGEWQKRAGAGGRVFDATLAGLYSQEWVPSLNSPLYPFYRQEIQLKLTVQPDGDTWSGPFVITDYGADGTNLGAGDGTMEATRIKMNPLP